VIGQPATTVEDRLKVNQRRGVYNARRAAALSGVPVSTLHYWARQGIYRPSISPGPRTRLWSWADLLALRAIDWLRRSKGPDVPSRVAVAKIRAALEEIERAGKSPADLAEIVAVTSGGDLFITTSDLVYRAEPDGQTAMPEVLSLVKPYLGGRGPDLLQPRPLLRIIAGKLHGEPHLAGTRIPSAAIYALARSGYTPEQIQQMYPEVSLEAIGQAIEFEQSLSPNAA
jgi:uncharacterized protein (DUF433 family)/DNA-binding transcriptional MerR regulator